MRLTLALLSPIFAVGLCAAPPAQTDSGARAEEWSTFLEAVRERALSHIESLPNFICTREMIETATFGGRVTPVTVTESRVEVSYFQGREQYRNLTQGPPVPEIGLTSEGEFGGNLHALFAPASNASFSLSGFENIRGRKAARIRFRVPQETSQLEIRMGPRRLAAAYEGECWADQESKQVIKLQFSTDRFPADFNMQRVEQSVEYDQVNIGERLYWLPIDAVSIGTLVARARGSYIDLYASIVGQRNAMTFEKAVVKIMIKFKNYRKFEAESKIVTEGP